jgi:hypothetical protein
MLLPWDHIGLCAQAQELPCTKTPTQKRWGKMVFTHTHPSQKLKS